ncbi:MAG: class I SAM-dependent methyltransferase [Pseudomonadota bacterium]
MILGWDQSAPGWIEAMGSAGDDTCGHVLDEPMLDALPATGRVLDIGCGEGRFCRMIHDRGLDSVGLEPTEALREQACAVHPGGTYVAGRAENLPFNDASFDAEVLYLTLIDILDLAAAICATAPFLSVVEGFIGLGECRDTGGRYRGRNANFGTADA